MKFIPDELFVGFKRQRKSEKPYLAYISLYIKDKASKQDSIEYWRDQDIPTEILKNELLEGFILGEKAGDSDERKAWVRVLDPRGFEIEISIDNLLLILESEGCGKEKRLKGKYIYAFDDASLLLIPESSSVYEELKKHTDAIGKKNITKDNIIPYEVYSNKSDEHLMYLGRLDTYTKHYLYNGKEYRKPEDAEKAYFADHVNKNPYNSSHVYEAYDSIEEKIHEKPEKYYWFFDGKSFRHTKTFPRYLVNHVKGAKDEFNMKEVDRMLTLSTALHKIVKKEWKPHSFEYFSEKIKSNYLCHVFSRKHAKSYSSYSDCKRNYCTVSYNMNLKNYSVICKLYDAYTNTFDTIEEIYDYLNPEFCELTLDNGECLKWFYDFEYYNKDSDLF